MAVLQRRDSAPEMAHMLSLRGVARHLGIAEPASTAEIPGDLPAPDGSLGGEPWWWSNTIADWLDDGGYDALRRPQPRTAS